MFEPVTMTRSASVGGGAGPALVGGGGGGFCANALDAIMRGIPTHPSGGVADASAPLPADFHISWREPHFEIGRRGRARPELVLSEVEGGAPVARLDHCFPDRERRDSNHRSSRAVCASCYARAR